MSTTSVLPRSGRSHFGDFLDQGGVSCGNTAEQHDNDSKSRTDTTRASGLLLTASVSFWSSMLSQHSRYPEASRL
jgi:hypothetical protein